MNSSAQPSRRIASNLLWTPQGLLRNPLVGVAADGRILSVGTCPEPDRCPGTEFYAGVLAPGLVNAHCHLELSYLLGAIPERCGFAGFAGAMSQVRERFSAEQRVQAVEAADAAHHARCHGSCNVCLHQFNCLVSGGNVYAGCLIAFAETFAHIVKILSVVALF